MNNKTRKRLKKIIFIVSIFFLLINFILISQAYHLTHFYEHGTVKSVEAQTNNFWGQAGVVLFGLKQEQLMPEAFPDSAFSKIKVKTKDSLTLDAWFIRVPHSKGAIA